MVEDAKLTGCAPSWCCGVKIRSKIVVSNGIGVRACCAGGRTFAKLLVLRLGIMRKQLVKLVAATVLLLVPQLGHQISIAGAQNTNFTNVSAPDFSTFLPTGYSLASATAMRLSGYSSPDYVITGVQPNDNGFPSSVIVAIQWNETTAAWAPVFSTLHEWTSQSQFNSGPGLIGDNYGFPHAEPLYDQRNGNADLVVWGQFVSSNQQVLAGDVVRFSSSGAHAVEYRFYGNYGASNGCEIASRCYLGHPVDEIGFQGEQKLSIYLPLKTSQDTNAALVRTYNYTVRFPYAPENEWAAPTISSNDLPYLGVNVSPASNSGLSLGLTVNGVKPNSPAAGHLRPGDVILGVSPNLLAHSKYTWTLGTPLIDEIELLEPKQKVTLTLNRGGRKVTTTITLGSSPVTPSNIGGPM